MLHCSWDMACDRCNYFSFWAIFCTFTPLTFRKIKMKKNEKNPLEISSLYTSVSKIMIICYTDPEIWCVTDVIVIFHFGLLFTLSPLTAQNIKILKKWKKKTPGDIINLHTCTKNYNHMMYGSWDMKHDRQNFLSFWTVFCHFTPLTTQKIKILKNWKKTPGDIIILHKCTKNHDHMLYCSLDMARNGFNCYFSFWAIFCPFTSLTAQKIKI